MNEKERVQSLLKENGLVAKKSFGQNFLINDGIIRKYCPKDFFATKPFSFNSD